MTTQLPSIPKFLGNDRGLLGERMRKHDTVICFRRRLAKNVGSSDRLHCLAISLELAGKVEKEPEVEGCREVQEPQAWL